MSCSNLSIDRLANLNSQIRQLEKVVAATQRAAADPAALFPSRVYEEDIATITRILRAKTDQVRAISKCVTKR